MRMIDRLIDRERGEIDCKTAIKLEKLNPLSPGKCVIHGVHSHGVLKARPWGVV